MDDTVVMCECFARDGLQHEEVFVPTASKVSLLESFVRAGFTRIEASSYSHPRRIPAFADVSDVLAAAPRRRGVAFKATCPNPRAVERAITDQDAGYGAEELSLLVSATESHTQRNLRTTRADQWANVTEMAALAKGRFTLVGVVSVAFGCPFEGQVPMSRIVEDVERFVDLGVDIITLGDTTGQGTPRTIAPVFRQLTKDHPDVAMVAHFHNTRGTALANCVAALDAGCRYFDSAFGGVGGHPAQIEYGSGMTGNAATEDLVSLFESMGVDTALDLDAVMDASRLCEEVLGRQLHSMVARAGLGTTQTKTTKTKEPADV